MMITVARTDAERAAAFDVMVQLRPHLAREEFVPRVRRQEAQGFRLALLRDARRIVRAVAGYRIEERLFGRVLYVDDLVTDEEARGAGYGTQLFEWLRGQAVDHRCARLELDSGNHRLAAHAFYRARGMVNRSLHFTLDLPPDPMPRGNGVGVRAGFGIKGLA